MNWGEKWKTSSADAAFPSMPFQLTANTLKQPPKVCCPLVMLFFVSSCWPNRLILRSPADVDLDYPATGADHLARKHGTSQDVAGTQGDLSKPLSYPDWLLGEA